MKEGILYNFRGYVFVTYFVRLASLVVCIYILTIFHINPLGFSIILLFILIVFLFSAIKKVVLYNDYIKFCTERILPFLNKEYKIKYEDIHNLDFSERKINYLTLILPGLGSINDTEFVFYLKNGNIKKASIRGNQDKIKEMYRLISERIN